MAVEEMASLCNWSQKYLHGWEVLIIKIKCKHIIWFLLPL